MEDVNNSRTEH